MPMYSAKGRYVSEAANKLEVSSISVEGFEDVFDSDSPEDLSEGDRTALDQTRNESSSVEDGPDELKHPITVEEAAAALGISANAVCKRLRKGTLTGIKVPGKFKEEWLVEGIDLIEVLDVDLPESEDSPKGEEENQWTDQDQTPDDARSVQDGPESAIESSVAMTRLIELVDKQAAKLEVAAGQIGYLKAQVDSQTRLLEAREAEIKLLTDRKQQEGWWSRFCTWFLGSRA